MPWTAVTKVYLGSISNLERASMSAIKHNAEPWQVLQDNAVVAAIADGSGNTIATLRWSDRADPGANAARSIACVNACVGIEDPSHAIVRARSFLRDIVAATTTPNGKRSSHGDEAAHVLRALGG